MEKNTIINRLVLFGSFNEAFLTSARSYKAHGIKVFFFEISEKKNWEKYSSCIEGGIVINPQSIIKSQLKNLFRQYIKDIRADAICAMSEYYHLWLQENKEFFLETNAIILSSNLSSLKFVSNKIDQINLAREIGFNILPTWVITNIEDCNTIPINRYPLCLRPYSNHVLERKDNFKVKIIYSIVELRSFISNRSLKKGIVVQPFLDLPNLVVHGVRSKNGNILEIEFFRAIRKFKGVTLSLKKNKISIDIKNKCIEFAEKSNFVGCFHFDFLWSEEDSIGYFLESNLRLGGTTGKVMKMGYDEANLLINAFGLKGKNEKNIFLQQFGYVTDKRALCEHILSVLKGTTTQLDHPNFGMLPDLLYSLYELIFVKSSVFSWRDIRGSLWGIFHIPSI